MISTLFFNAISIKLWRHGNLLPAHSCLELVANKPEQTKAEGMKCGRVRERTSEWAREKVNEKQERSERSRMRKTKRRGKHMKEKGRGWHWEMEIDRQRLLDY